MTVARTYLPWLWIFFGLFFFRVVAQLVVYRFDVPLLPSFDSWHSGAVSYPVLVFVQVMILGVMLRIITRFTLGREHPRAKLGKIRLTFGIVYFTVMLGRILVGVTGLSESLWFHRYIPASFHLVIASFVITVGLYHVREGRRNEGGRTLGDQESVRT